MKKTTYLFGLICGTLSLAACGGGDSSDSNQVKDISTTSKYIQITGTAFAENPLKNANIQAICQDNTGFKESVKSNEYGEWQGQIESDKLPCRLSVNIEKENYYSYIDQGTRVNINPFTDMIVAMTSGQVPSIWYKTGKDLNKDQLLTATQNFQKTMQEKHYNLDNKINVFTDATKLNDNVHSNIQSFLASLDKQVILKNYDTLVLLIKDGNLKQIPEKITLTPKFYGQNVNLSACIHNSNFPTLYTNCSDKLLQDIEIVNLVDKQSGEKCIFKKLSDVLTLSKSNVQIKVSLSEKDILPNNLSLSNGYELNVKNIKFILEWGQQVLKEYSFDLNVSDQGEILSVTGKSNEPKQEFTCISQ